LPPSRLDNPQATALFAGVNMPKKSIVFCSTPRSGSTFVCNTLASTGVIPKPDEWLHADRLLERRQAYRLLDSGVDDYTLVKEIVRREVNPNGYFSIKIMWPQLCALLGIGQKRDPDNDRRVLHAIFELFPNPILIHITRSNRLRQAISWARAIKTGVWHHVAGLTEPLPAQFDFVLIRSLIQIIKDEDQPWKGMLDEADCPTRSIAYEEFSRNPAGYTRQIYSEFGVQLPELQEISGNTIVASDGLNSMWERQYLNTLATARKMERRKGVRLLPLSSLLATADRLTLEPMRCGMKKEVAFHVVNNSSDLWPAIGAPNGVGWLTLQAEWLNRTTQIRALNPDRGYLEHDVAGGSWIDVPLLLTAPMEPGIYDLDVRLVQTKNAESYSRTVPAVRLRIEVEAETWRREFQAYFGECAVSAQVLHVSPWFGSFLPFDFPWIEHQVHGWLRCIDGFGLAHGIFRFEDSELGVWETTPDHYPELIQIRENRVLCLDSHTGNGRILIDLGSGKRHIVRPGVKAQEHRSTAIGDPSDKA
jgi:trehalose 2-sulfotransferase